MTRKKKPPVKAAFNRCKVLSMTVAVGIEPDGLILPTDHKRISADFGNRTFNKLDKATRAVRINTVHLAEGCELIGGHSHHTSG